MSGPIRTLILESNGTHWVAVGLDTLGHGLRRSRREAPSWVTRSRVLRKLFGDRYADASYVADWRDAFLASPALDISVCSTTDLIGLGQMRSTLHEYDLIVVLHSAAGDRMSVLSRTAAWFQGRRGKLVLFVGNEYDLLDEKIAFARTAGVDLICSQLPLDAASTLYADAGARVVAMPHALNPHVYRAPADDERAVDVGFAGDLYDRIIGDRERTGLVEFFQHAAPAGLRTDIRTTRMPRADYAAFLQRCKAVCGAESGTYYLQPSGAAVKAAKAYVRRHPSASFDEVWRACFADCGPTLNGKAISSRHFEPIGTRTCQLLLDGRYNDVLVPDVHYIAVRRDLSNVTDAVRRAMDPDERRTITAAAYAHVSSAHTYAHRVESVVALVR